MSFVFLFYSTLDPVLTHATIIVSLAVLVGRPPLSSAGLRGGSAGNDGKSEPVLGASAKVKEDTLACSHKCL